MIHYETPVNTIQTSEEDRLKRIQQYGILDTPAENDFDTIALLAAEIFETQNASIWFIDKEDIFFKSNLNIQETVRVSREHSLYAPVIFKQEIAVFKNVLMQEDIRFFAAAPILTTDGFMLGAISVNDHVPHLEVSNSQIKMLQLLSGMIMEKLEERFISRKIAQNYHERFHRLSHDIKNPVTSISLYAQLLGSREMSRDKVFSMAEKIEKSCRGIEKNLQELTG